jgi:hypothetical protein
VIVDYRTDDVSAAALEHRFQSCQEQGLWSYRAVREAARERVKDVFFFFVRSGEISSIKPKEL